MARSTKKVDEKPGETTRKPSARSRTKSVPPVAPATALETQVRERAYLLAEQNGFAGDPGFYWTLAERELGGHPSRTTVASSQ